MAFGYDKSYKVICAEQDIPSLKERRLSYIDNFVMKTINNSKFQNVWYPFRDEDVHNIRDRRPYKETRARTKRYFNSPLAFLRRRANELYLGQEIERNVNESY